MENWNGRRSQVGSAPRQSAQSTHRDFTCIPSPSPIYRVSLAGLSVPKDTINGLITHIVFTEVDSASARWRGMYPAIQPGIPSQNLLLVWYGGCRSHSRWENGTILLWTVMEGCAGLIQVWHSICYTARLSIPIVPYHMARTLFPTSRVSHFCGAYFHQLD